MSANKRPAAALKTQTAHAHHGFNAAIWDDWHQRFDGGPVVKRRQLSLHAGGAGDAGPVRREIPPKTRFDDAVFCLRAMRVASPPCASKSLRSRWPRKDLAGKKLCCDKCDGGHATDDCPHFKHPREEHKDAWIMMGKGGAFNNIQSAPMCTVRSARVVRQPCDGSCLFHSLSYGLGGGCSGSSLRREIISFISKNPDVDVGPNTLRDWIEYEQGVSVGSYVHSMFRGGWGGAIEMAVLSKIRGVTVHVYERCSEGYQRISAFEGSDAGMTINVLYQGRMHYDALLI